MRTTYLPRAVDPLLGQLLTELPAIAVLGPRATGKTTTAARHAATVVRLDRRAEAAAFHADPDAALRELPEPVLLDEWQMVPDVLGAVKRAVDAEPRPGRFLLAGSVRADLMAEGWPGTGRLVRVGMSGLTVRELIGSDPGVAPFLDRVAAQGAAGLVVPADPPDLRGYLELALRSGFPEPALRLSDDTRARWLRSYVDQLLTRDAADLIGPRDPRRLGRYFEAYALSSAGIVTDATVSEAAGVSRRTAVEYERLLGNLLVVDQVPAWSSNRVKRLTRAAKRYVVDPGLLAAVLRLDVPAILRDGDLLGRIIDTFVTAQLRAELPLSSAEPRLYHLRQEKGAREVDLIAEMGAGRVVAIEVKAQAAPRPESFRHLRWLRDELGDRFVAGVLLHTGPRTYEVDDRVIAAPICTLWG